MSKLGLRIVCLIGLVGCGPVAPDPDGGSGTDGSGADDGGGGGGSSGGGGGDDGGGSSGGGSSGGGSSGGSSGGGDDGGDGGDPSDSLEEACERVCRKLVECFPDQPGMDECMDMCLDSSGEGPECHKPMIEYYDCVAALPCSAFEGEGDFCAAEVEAIPPECLGEEECVFGGGSSPDGTECSVSEHCPSYTHEMVCDVEFCECQVDGETISRCPSGGICSDDEALFDYFYECCNFP
jgi:hypothetical protein